MLFLTVLALPMMVNAAPKEHKFKNPSFSGVGTSGFIILLLRTKHSIVRKR